jgi:hypothetical protein
VALVSDLKAALFLGTVAVLGFIFFLWLVRAVR